MIKYLLIALGWVSVCLAILGVFLPILPTTPFVLLASYLFYRSSPKARQWLLQHRYFGVILKSYYEHRSIPLRIKIISLSILWVTMMINILFLIPLWWVNVLLLCVSVGVTIHIVKFKTSGKNENQ